MARMICTECDNDFDEADGYVMLKEPHPELDGCPIEIIGELRCPFCGAEWWSLEEVEDDALL